MSLHPREAVDERWASRTSKERACRAGRGSDPARPWPQGEALAQAVDHPPKEVRERREKQYTLISIVPINEIPAKNTGKYETKSPRALELETYKRKQKKSNQLSPPRFEPAT